MLHFVTYFPLLAGSLIIYHVFHSKMRPIAAVPAASTLLNKESEKKTTFLRTFFSPVKCIQLLLLLLHAGYFFPSKMRPTAAVACRKFTLF